MGLFSKKQKTDPAAAASQQASQAVMQQMANAKLPDLPSIAAAAPPAVNVPTSMPSYLGGGQPMTFTNLPNQLSMIANQLSAGGYGSVPTILKQMQGLNRPMTVGAAPPPAPVAAPTAPAAPVAAAPAAAPAAPKTATVAKPIGFTAQQQPYQPPIPGYSGGSLNQGPMFQTFSDFRRFLNNPNAYTGSIYSGGR